MVPERPLEQTRKRQLSLKHCSAVFRIVVPAEAFFSNVCVSKSAGADPAARFGRGKKAFFGGGGQKRIFVQAKWPFPYTYHVKGGQFGGKRIFAPQNYIFAPFALPSPPWIRQCKPGSVA